MYVFVFSALLIVCFTALVITSTVCNSRVQIARLQFSLEQQEQKGEASL